MSCGKTGVVITPGDRALGYSILFFALSIFTIPFLIGVLIAPIFGLYFLYHLIHQSYHWIRVSRSEINIHYLIYSVTIPKDEFIRASISDTRIGNLSVLTLQTDAGDYRFGLIDNPKYATDILRGFKNGTLFPDTTTKDSDEYFSEGGATGTTEREIHAETTHCQPDSDNSHIEDTATHQDGCITSHTEQKEYVLSENERKGKILENAVYEYLSSSGKVPKYHRELCNLYIPTKPSHRTEVDVLMIHSTGIYVFECKNHAGYVYGSDDNVFWTVVYSDKSKHKLYNPIKQNIGHINALAKYLRIPAKYFCSCIVFGNDARLKKVPEDSYSYLISNYSSLNYKLTKHIQVFQECLSPEDINRIYDSLEPFTDVSEDIKANHRVQVSKFSKR